MRPCGYMCTLSTGYGHPPQVLNKKVFTRRLSTLKLLNLRLPRLSYVECELVMTPLDSIRISGSSTYFYLCTDHFVVSQLVKGLLLSRLCFLYPTLRSLDHTLPGKIYTLRPRPTSQHSHLFVIGNPNFRWSGRMRSLPCARSRLY